MSAARDASGIVAGLGLVASLATNVMQWMGEQAAADRAHELKIAHEQTLAAEVEATARGHEREQSYVLKWAECEAGK